MARARVKPGEEKAPGGRPPSLDEQAYIEMGHALVKWAQNAPTGSYFKDFILDTPYTQDQVNHAEKVSEEFARLKSKAQITLARKWRSLGVEKSNPMIARLLPLVDPDYKEWRMTELKLQAAANADPKAALDEIMNKSQSPIKE